MMCLNDKKMKHLNFVIIHTNKLIDLRNWIIQIDGCQTVGVQEKRRIHLIHHGVGIAIVVAGVCMRRVDGHGLRRSRRNHRRTQRMTAQGGSLSRHRHRVLFLDSRSIRAENRELYFISGDKYFSFSNSYFSLSN